MERLELSSSAQTVAILTVPSLLWLLFRFYEFLSSHHKSVRHHVKGALNSTHLKKDGSRKRDMSALAYALHVVTGLPLLLAAIYLASLFVPTQQPSFSEPTLFLQIVATALVVVNSTVFSIFPHPSRHKTYNADRRRFCSGMIPLYVAALQFTAMPLSAWVFLTNLALPKIAILVTVSLIYLFTILVCATELIWGDKCPWEDQAWAQPFLKMLGYGIKSKSKMTYGMVEIQSSTVKSSQTFMMVIFAISGILAMFQSCCVLFAHRDLLPAAVTGWATTTKTAEASVPRGLEYIFIVIFLYSTMIMAAGFFALGQTIGNLMDLNEEDSKKHDDQPQSPSTISTITEILRNDGGQQIAKLLLEVLLTQAMPLMLLVVGPEFVGTATFGEFLVRFFLWV